MTEQPNEVTLEEGQDQTADSEQVTIPDWFVPEEQFKSLQADHTRKAQELAELKRRQEAEANEPMPEEEKQLVEWNKKQWFVTTEDLQKFQKQQIMEAWFRDLLQSNPDLKKYESIIRTAQAVDWGSFEEVAIKHWLTTSDKLEKAKASRGKMLGSDTKNPPATKSITDMSVEEYEEWKSKNGVSYSAGLTGSSSI